MMLDEDVVAASPSTVYRVLRAENRLDRWKRSPSKKGKGFVQPLEPHQHWHAARSGADRLYQRRGTFYYLCTLLDGCSPFIVHGEIREAMKEADIELLIERARERFPGVKPRIISDNGPQFIAKDFKTYIRLVGMTHVRISPYCPQSNGKIERWHKTLKGEAIRIKSPASMEDARQVVERFVEHYNGTRLHSASGYITPEDRLHRRQKAIWDERDRKLELARERRAQHRQQAPQHQRDAAC